MKYPHPNIIDIQAPKWSHPQRAAIDVEIKWTHSAGSYWPFTAIEDDSEAHGAAIFDAAKRGEYGDIEPFDHEAHQEQESRRQDQATLRGLELEIAPLRDEALAGIISDDDRQQLATLVSQAKAVRQRLSN